MMVAAPKTKGTIRTTKLVEVLRDPADVEHEDSLEWLGLDDATEFDPENFDAEALTLALCLAR
jgi:hypothetical protein